MHLPIQQRYNRCICHVSLPHTLSSDRHKDRTNGSKVMLLCSTASTGVPTTCLKRQLLCACLDLYPLTGDLGTDLVGPRHIYKCRDPVQKALERNLRAAVPHIVGGVRREAVDLALSANSMCLSWFWTSRRLHLLQSSGHLLLLRT